MKKTRIYMIIIILLFQVALPMLTAMVENSYAVETEEYEEVAQVDYLVEYNAWLKLSESEKIDSLKDRFSLEDIIPENVGIRDQGSTGACWAFSALRTLETSLAMSDLKNGFVAKEYDFSERHMDYATAENSFKNSTNEYGFNRNVGYGGLYTMARSYLTNGTGAIPESEMPFEDNTNNIYLSEIQNKTVSSKVIDTITFPKYSDSITEEQMNEIKYYIKKYGGVCAYMRYRTGYRNRLSDTEAAYYNNTNMETTHAVTIIGWDDNYSRDNFYSSEQTKTKPTNNGAWIVKNSLGEGVNTLYISYESTDIYDDNLYAITKATTNVDYEYIYQRDFYGKSGEGFAYEFPSEESNKVYLANPYKRETEDTEYLTEVSIYADEGYTCKVYINPDYVIPEGSDLKGGLNLTDNLIEVELEAGETEIFEYEGYHTLEFLEPIELTGDYFVVIIEIQSNDSEVTIYKETPGSGAGYWGNATYSEKCFYGGEEAFNGDDTEWINFSTERGDSTIKAFTTSEIVDDSLKEIVVTTAPEKTEYIEGQSFDETGMVLTAVFNNGVSRELISGENAKYVIENEEVLNVNEPVTVSYTYEGVTVTAEVPITVNRNKAVSLEITKEPDTVECYEGKAFNSTGMVVTATLLDGTTKVVEDYTVVNGENLQYGQEAVTISYDGVTIELGITVIEKKLESIAITTEPKKTTYIEGQSFETEGMIITATYNSGDTANVTNYTVIGGEVLQPGQTSVTISYTEDGITKTTQQNIVVEVKKLENIEITKAPEKITYIEGQSFETEGMIITATYNSGDTANVTNYTVIGGEVLQPEQTSVTISYSENGITKTAIQEITVLEKLKISFEEYVEVKKDNNNHIKNIKINTSIEQMKANIATNGEIKVYKGNTEITDLNAKTATGMTIRITLRDENREYIVSVTGDVNGDGKINVRDILAINKHRLNKKPLTGANLLAGDITGDGEANIRDILQINKYRLGKINSL